MSLNIQLSPILATARDILKDNKNKPMHVNEIAEIAVKSARNQTMLAEEFAAKLSSALAAHLKLKTSKPIFSKPLNKQGKPQKGVYRLKQERIATIASKIIVPPVSTGFMGKAGEHAVMSELLFWGYNASLMTVDEGIDIVASKAGRYFHIQVKASSERPDGSFGFKILLKAFLLNQSAQTFYVFVLRRELSCFFAILPNSFLENLRLTNTFGKTGDLSVNITTDNKFKRFSLNGSDITGWINNFEVIK